MREGEDSRIIASQIEALSFLNEYKAGVSSLPAK